MASSRKQGKSSGLRMLWIPGGRKHHSKSRHETTNKHISYIGNQKKSEVWSMGGSRAQRDIIEADADTSLLDGPSVSARVPLITVTAAAKCVPDHEASTNENPSTAPTAPLDSKESSPDLTTTADVMPARTQVPILVTTKATAEIVDVSKLQENRFALLGKDLPEIEDNEHVEISSTSQKSDKEALDSSIETTASTATTPSTTPKSTTDHNSPSKRKHKNHNNNNQSDVNSIESLPDNPKIPDKNLDWMDELILQDNKNDQTLPQQKHKKQHKKKSSKTKTKNLDTLDGVGGKSLNNSDGCSTESDDDADDKLVKCIYYTLMCCECSIS